MKLSIIVPVYNMAADQKLEYCLDSLVNQTLEDYEIIAVDDASADESLRILQQYEREYPQKVRVLALKENHRQGGAKNAGLKLARG
ncbi:MAG: glycosyltransferase [Lachnospiraceae bacterium]|nr:glycosyltransferase [Lachnospiraceae bacterium]